VDFFSKQSGNTCKKSHAFNTTAKPVKYQPRGAGRVDYTKYRYMSHVFKTCWKNDKP
jgi:hypothetical protein